MNRETARNATQTSSIGNSNQWWRWRRQQGRQTHSREKHKAKARNGSEANWQKKPSRRKEKHVSEKIQEKKQNMPTERTNKEDKRNHRRRTRPKTKTHRMGRYRANRIQSTQKMGMPIWRLSTWNRWRTINILSQEQKKPWTQPSETQTTTCPYCRNTYSATDKLLMRLELLPHQGTRNVENAQISRLKTPQRQDGAMHFSKWKETWQSSACSASDFPASTNQ